MKPRIVYIWMALLALLTLPLTAVAQSDPGALDISLRRDFGSAFGGRISGTFSIRVNDPPPDVTRVVFLLDDAEIGTDDSAPFRFQFRTGNFEPGGHTLSAVAYDSSGNEIGRGAISRTFMTSGESTNVILWVVIPLLIISIGGRYLATWITNRKNPNKQPAITGPLGGAICSNCGKPFAIHIWSLNLAVFRIDRCPHCGKWIRATRADHDALQAAAEALNESETAVDTSPSDDDIQRRLNDSRFDN